MVDAIAAISTGAKQSPPDFTIPAATVFTRAVVLQTLNDPSLRDPIADQGLINTLRNKEYYLRAPRNSVICRVVSERKGLITNNDFVCFPFFSSHIMLPVKAGEQVWLFMELPERPYWLSRIPEPLHVEDANFTHGERRIQRDFKGSIDSKTNRPFDDGSGNFDETRKLKFQNGNPSKTELATIAGDQSAFLTVITGSKEFSVTSLEPVPRVTKRPGDLVIQGSNNATIRLGTEMGWNASETARPNTETSNSIASNPPGTEKHLPSGLGAIDIVVGRGRYFQDPSAEKNSDGKKSGKPKKNTTRPYIEETVLMNLDKKSVFETDKNVSSVQDESISKSKGNFRTNPPEGDPDFLMDAARVYVSTKSEIDKVLNTGEKGTAKGFEKPIVDKTGSTVAIKSDHIRIIARKSGAPGSPEDDNTKTNGSIRIIKEGKNNEDLATITIEEDGTVQISGKKIFLGRKSDDGGAGGGPGPGKSQPYVKYQQLEDLLNKTFDDLKTFVTKLQQNFGGPTNATPGFGGPNPALVKSAADECTQFLTSIENRRQEIKNLKSNRIFGE